MSEPTGIPALARKKFKLSLLVAIPALVVTTGGLIVFFTLSNTRRTMEDFGWALFREATNQSINETRNVIREAIPDIETLANLYRKGLLEADRTRQAGFYAEILRSHNDYSWVSFGDEYGTFVGANRPEPDGKLLRTNISWLAGGRTLSYEYDVDDRGFQKFYKFDGNAGYDPRTRPFYELAKKPRNACGHLPTSFLSRVCRVLPAPTLFMTPLADSRVCFRSTSI
jgi:hypothetical protein